MYSYVTNLSSDFVKYSRKNVREFLPDGLCALGTQIYPPSGTGFAIYIPCFLPITNEEPDTLNYSAHLPSNIYKR